MASAYRFQWHEIPECYGKWETVNARFRKGQGIGLLERIFQSLNGESDMQNLSIDSTCAKVYESANGNKKSIKLGCRVLKRRTEHKDSRNCGRFGLVK